jgi:4-hydroxybenzoyl-CoA reductase alpha subunit
MMSDKKKQFSIVGKSVPRLDGPEKVMGKTQFTDDLSMPGMLYGKMLGAKVAHAKIKSIDTSKAEQVPGVVAVITGKDTPKPYSINDHLPSEYALTPEKVRYYGEAIACVAAIDEETAEEAADLIEVDYEQLPPLIDPLEAMAQDDVRVHEGFKNNIHVEGKQDFGDVDKALKESHVVVENTYYSSYVQNGFLEPQSCLADYNSGTGLLTVYHCISLPHYMHQALARTLEMPMEKIRVVVPTIGGAFGCKTEPTPSALAACFLSRRLGKPVKITYDRDEVFYQNKGRHPCHMKMKMGFDKEGNITGVDFDNTLDGGAHSSWGLVVMWFTAALAHLPYKIPNVRFDGRRIYTNKPTTGAQRCLGGVQVRLAIESLLDQGANELGVSPLDLRLKNAVESGYEAVAAVKVRHSEFKKCLRSVAKRSGYEEKRGNLPFGHGVGMAGGHYSTGGAYLLYNSLRPHSVANIRVDNEAGVTVFTGGTDVGQGATTVIPQMAAEVFGLDHKDIHLVCQDTLLAPMDNGTYDSRLTYGAGHAVKNAALDVLDKLFKFVGAGMNVPAFHLRCGEGMIYSTFDPKKKIPFYDAVARYYNSVGALFGTGDYTPPQPKAKYPGNLIGPSPAFGFTAQVAEVKVDTDTGKVNIVKYYESGDCGQAINPMSVEGQVDGALSMGIGQALYEEMVMGEDGRMLNPSFHEYTIPGVMDMPEIDGEIVESYDPTSAFGSKEVGEGPVGPVIPAIMNAIEDAIGVRITDTPITPERILKALGKL